LYGTTSVGTSRSLRLVSLAGRWADHQSPRDDRRIDAFAHGTRGAAHFAEEETTGREDVSGRERSTDGRAFREEEPTGRFKSEQLDALRARSLEKSSMFNASIEAPRVDVVTAPHPAAKPPAAGPTPSSPEFLGKSTAVLVLPAAVPEAKAPPPPPAPPPPAVIEAPAPPPAVVEAPAPAVVEPPAPAPPVVVRSHRRLRVNAVATPRRRVWRHVIKLALLALVVVCQPWWWNVGDLTARPTARPTAPTTAVK